ncbi:hypothetical protein HNP46_006491 [Pseudomonas nitritireducens]|uniref:Uncharacterized protein n=1 Tax=Pseudomonas nitroreducens TaxID=46680 RepID=A0A7W7P5R8_PSENT|nr:hypothetical protein [Pseudomonas nitritireducens]
MSQPGEVDKELLQLWRTGRCSRDRGLPKPYLLQDMFRDLGAFLAKHVHPELVFLGILVAGLTVVFLMCEPLKLFMTFCGPAIVVVMICGLLAGFDDDSERCKCKGKYCPCCGKRRH